MKAYIVIIFFMCAIGCTNYKTVIITKDYVINPNWDKVGNALEIYKMKLKDTSQIIGLINPSEQELYYGLIKDSSFSFIANVKYNGESYLTRKVYFNRENGFVWRRPPNIDISRSMTYNTIGELQQDTWYLLAGSQLRSLYYVFLDSSDSLHVFKVSTMTNY